MKLSALVIIIICSFSLVFSQDKYELWKDEKIPYYKENSLKEYEKEIWNTKCVYNITKPELTIYPAKGDNSGKAVIVLPGGGYSLVALHHEGYDVAKVLSENGITAIVLKYRLPYDEASEKPHLAPIHDLEKALSVVREKADQYGFDKNNIGVMGFSAGAHLGATASVLSKKKPDFALLIYGKFNTLDGTQIASDRKLSLENISQEEIKGLNLLSLISKDTPPTFLTHSIDDETCPYQETVEYATNLTKHNVPAEVHLFPTGNHGYGLGRETGGTKQWIHLAITWIKNL